MDAPRKQNLARSAVLLALAGAAFSLSALLQRDARPVIVATQALGAALFFLASYLHYRRSR